MTAPDPLPLHVTRRINAACERFEADWRAGKCPLIWDTLRGWAGPGRAALLAELIALELELRRASGDRPDRREYLDQFPKDEDAVAAAFDADSAAPAETVAHVEARDVLTGALPSFGDFELLDEIGRGGMGVIYKARQLSLNRLVALKMILSGGFASPDERTRFRLEAELAANLEHPNIVPIYEVGEHDGRPYFSMKLVEGGSLAGEVTRLSNDPLASARLLATIARAMDHAHRRGFVHCDLKPSNILLDDQGRPHVTDFGLARRVDGQSTLTASGAVMGSPSYMAPEQASGGRKDLTPTADVYGLGAVLYELLTGRPPFVAPTVMETVVKVLEREPEPPSRLNRSVPRGLESICLRCLEKSPGDRYASAADLAEALDQYLRGDDVTATTPVRRFLRWARREPELASRLFGLAAVGLFTQYNYAVHPTPDAALHYQIQGVLAAWALASALFQVTLRRGVRPEAVRYAWATTDVLAITTAIAIVDGFDSDLVVAYPVIIAASGLWFRESLVWLTTALAVLGYSALALNGLYAASVAHPRHYPNIILACLLITGFAVARQVKRFWTLSTYFEARPGKDG